MNILVITAQKPDSTGSGVYVAETVRGLARAGHEVALVAGIDRDDAPALPDDVDFHPVRFRTDELPFPVCGMSDQMPYEATRYRDMTPEMVERFKRAFDRAVRSACQGELPDIVLTHHLYLASAQTVETLCALAAERACARPSIRGICHSTDLRQMGKHSLERDFIVGRIRELDCIFALHDAQKREIVDTYGVDEARVRVVGSGYNDALFSPQGRCARREGDPVRVAYAGKIWRKKGTGCLIECADLLRTPPEKIEFYLIGGHNDETEYGELAARASASRYRFDFPGKVGQRRLADFYRASDVFVLPSFFEGLPLVVIEALACGCKAVVTDLPGIRPWIEANIPAAPVWYVAPPRMESVDEPVAADLPAFEARLAAAIDEAAAAPAPRPEAFKGIENVTWAGLAEKLVAR